mmetsp:Transcript_11513/g.10185  ORF Transcript_11513/g.10185 Transcript_11513/m.10185 type:complete len:295 (+) Transcript_11513:15-899(+)
MSVALRRLRGHPKQLVNQGAFTVGIITGFVAYWSWRIKLKKEFLLGHGLYRFNHAAANITPWKSQWLTWYRMPDQEYEVNHLFRPYYVIGQLDYSKEILIPKKKTINHTLIDGYDVISPLYCYDGGRFNPEAKKLDKMDSIITSDRAAIIINRGWIPQSLKDKKKRLWEKNSRQLVKIQGTMVQAKDIHDYSIPNNPDNNEWNNLAPEDIARFWELSNFNELKQFYFQQIDLGNVGGTSVGNSSQTYSYPMMKTKEEVIREYYNWMGHEKWNKLAYYSLTPVSIVSFWVFFLTV